MEIKRVDMAAVIEPRVEELFTLVRQEVKRNGYDGLLPAGAVLTGGTSRLPGIKEVASETLHLPARTAQPDKLTGLIDRIQSPAHATAHGLLHWAQILEEEAGLESFHYGRIALPKLSLERATEFLKRLLPG